MDFIIIFISILLLSLNFGIVLSRGTTSYMRCSAGHLPPVAFMTPVNISWTPFLRNSREHWIPLFQLSKGYKINDLFPFRSNILTQLFLQAKWSQNGTVAPELGRGVLKGDCAGNFVVGGH